jgi:hypothetical protein
MHVLPSRLRQGLTPILALVIKGGAVLCLCASLRANPAILNEEGKTSSEVRAAFLVVFAKYTQWPDSRMPAEGEEFVVGVLGDDPLVAALKALPDPRVMGRKVVIKRFTTPAELQRCQVLFFPKSQEGHFPQLRDRLAAQSVLTVGETARFCDLGGAFRFIEEASRLKFIVNLSALEQAHLRVEPKALRLAKSIITKPQVKP